MSILFHSLKSILVRRIILIETSKPLVLHTISSYKRSHNAKPIHQTFNEQNINQDYGSHIDHEPNSRQTWKNRLSEEQKENDGHERKRKPNLQKTQPQRSKNQHRKKVIREGKQQEGGVGHKVKLLIKYAKFGIVDKAEATIKELEGLPGGFVLGAGLRALLLDMYVTARNLPAARSALTAATAASAAANQRLMPSKVLALAVLMAEEGTVAECEELLEDQADAPTLEDEVVLGATDDHQPTTYQSRAGESRAGESRAGESRAGESRAGESRAGESRAGESRTDELGISELKTRELRSIDVRTDEHRTSKVRIGQSRTSELRTGEAKSDETNTGAAAAAAQNETQEEAHIIRGLCVGVVTAVGRRGDVAGARRLLGGLLRLRYARPSRPLLGALVSAHLLKDDFEGALAEIEAMVASHGVLPCKTELTRAFLQSKDAARLQRVLDASTQVMGAKNSMLDLAIVLVENGSTNHAASILQGLCVQTAGGSFGVSLRERLVYLCRRYLRAGDVVCVERLVAVTYRCPGIDRVPLYQCLLDVYKRAGEFDKVTGLWARMQEEDVTPDDVLLYDLGTFLRRHKTLVPFTIPACPSIKQEDTTATTR